MINNSFMAVGFLFNLNRNIWLYSLYGDCNATCGSDSYRTRTVECVSLNTNPISFLSSEHCSGLETPVGLHKRCFVPVCYSYEWLHGDWSEVSLKFNLVTMPIAIK